MTRERNRRANNPDRRHHSYQRTDAKRGSNRASSLERASGRTQERAERDGAGDDSWDFCEHCGDYKEDPLGFNCDKCEEEYRE